MWVELKARREMWVELKARREMWVELKARREKGDVGGAEGEKWSVKLPLSSPSFEASPLLPVALLALPSLMARPPPPSLSSYSQSH
jgi:hypothetical protein